MPASCRGASLKEPVATSLNLRACAHGRHTGKRIAGASMHRDPLLSTGRRPFFHWGHVWVVVSIEVEAFGKSWALPVLFRLHRSKKRCMAEKRPYLKTTEQARELIEMLAKEFPDRRFEVVADAAYTNSSLIKKRPSNVTLIGRSRLDAALYPPLDGEKDRWADRACAATASHLPGDEHRTSERAGRRSRSTSTARR